MTINQLRRILDRAPGDSQVVIETGTGLFHPTEDNVLFDYDADIGAWILPTAEY